MGIRRAFGTVPRSPEFRYASDGMGGVILAGGNLVFTHKSALTFNTSPSRANDISLENTLSREGRW
jgi:hypothetical protein